MRAWRSPPATAAARPAVPVPLDRMPLLRAGRPLKAWRWVGAFSPELLLCVAFAEGGELRFAAEAVRARRENLLLVRSASEQPFGTFAGELPGAAALREGFGVMERHEVRW